MNNKLPHVYVNKVGNCKNNDTVSYGYKEHREAKPNEYKTNITQKIKSIFNSPKNVYKVDVEIKTKSGIFFKTLIGKNSANLITIDNELISIKEILDIKIKE